MPSTEHLASAWALFQLVYFSRSKEMLLGRRTWSPRNRFYHHLICGFCDPVNIRVDAAESPCLSHRA